MNFFEWLRIILIGIVEGVTEWLPISSTGHMILLDAIWPTGLPNIITPEFWTMFEVVIQLGAILAVVTLYFDKLNPFSRRKTVVQKRGVFTLWAKVLVGCLPAAVIGFFLDDWVSEKLNSAFVVAAMLILYGIAFIFLENRNKMRGERPQVSHFHQLSFLGAFLIGSFQILAMVPGTSRSGVTILGAMLLGCSRFIATEYSFYLAIPVMFGASFLRIVKFLKGGIGFVGPQLAILLLGMVVAYLVSILAIKFLMGYLRRHDFKAFGWYRIILGIVVLLYFGLFVK